MSHVFPTGRVVVGLGGVAMTAHALYQYVNGEVNAYVNTELVGGLTMLGSAVYPCIHSRVVPVTVTPHITEPSGPMWWRQGGANTPVQIAVSLTQQPAVNRYSGDGILHRAANTIDVFRDARCQRPLVFDHAGNAPVSHQDLAAGLPLYVRGTAAGTVQLQLTLDPATTFRTTVQAPVTCDVEIRAVNIITPTITAEGLVLVHGNNLANPTTLSTVTLGYTQSDASYPCNDLQTALVYGNQISCRHALLPANTYHSGTASATLNLALLMRGQAAGACVLTAQLSSASGATDPSWYIAPAVNVTIRVERLEFDPYLYRDGGANAVLGRPLTRVVAGGNPKRRQLHEHDATDAFTPGRVPIKRPNAAFWTHASHLTLTTDPGLQLFSDQACTVPAVDLQQGDFIGAEYDLWVKTTAVSPMDAQPVQAVVHPLPLRHPEQVITPHRIYCGATLNGRQLLHGDIVEFDAFGFDRQLDRRVGNLTSAHLAGVGQNQRNMDSALSVAGAHKYYDRFSVGYVNRQNPAPHGGLYAAFRGALNGAPGNNAAKAAAGTTFVHNYLLNQHGAGLGAPMRALLNAHILRVLNAAGVAGFNQNAGTPGTHAEILAVDELLTAGVPFDDISVATYKVHHSNGRGKHFMACANCHGILLPLGVPTARVITG